VSIINTQASDKQLFGLLNVYKPIGMTSHDVVATLRRITKIKQIGHTGTLDPFAEGVLPICIGKATRLIEYFADEKEYLATVQFGASTTTYDIEGEKTYISDKKISTNDIDLTPFLGEIEQLPPIYSAIKVKGKKLYEYAREGKEVEIKPRKVVIDKIELKNFDEQSQQAQILIKCSKGTYIRSIAHDLGQNLGVGAHLIKLVRTQVGNFRVENSVKLDGINVTENLINPVEMLNLPIIPVCDKDLENIRHGMPVNVNSKFDIKNNICNNYVILTYNNVITAVGQFEKDKIKLKKVFL
jgi:tRNA pseudouridine55 synthase